MEVHKAVILLCLFLFTDVLEAYIKTDGAWIVKLPKSQYTVKTVEDCAVKCNKETSFTCRSFLYIEKDQDCVTLPANSKTDQILRRISAALYEKKEYLLECVNGIGTDYRGTKSKTKLGKTCQRWEGTFPHVTNITPKTHPKADLESNFCRNPDGDKGGPWCYTTDPEKRWEHCDIQDCTEECMQCSGENYRGKISTTASGFTCQRWDSQKPHNHGYIPSALPDKYLEENHCRNPDGEPKPWCFTTSPSKRWESCSIPRCTTEPPTIVPELTCASGEGSSYRGTIAVTVSGKTCQEWSSQSPHKHSRTPENYPCKGLDENYCRNPDNERSPWCYTTDPETHWEYCSVPSCGDQLRPEEPVIPEGEECYEGDGSSYHGAMSETVSGKKCQFWTSMEPHRHSKTPQNFPAADLRRNLCRNPDGDRAPWCYTTDPTVRWEYCNIERCDSKPSTQEPPTNPTDMSYNVLCFFLQDCKVGNGETYRGPTSTTIVGVTCQAWSSMTPHQHASFTPETHPDKGLESNVGLCRIFSIFEGTHSWQKINRIYQPLFSVIPEAKIVGGCISKAHSWPWQISLRTRGKIHFCGGTLIDAQWVLTAAHCLERSESPSAYKILLGIHTERATESSKQERDVSKIIKGPAGTDIALLKLDRPALINDKVLPACLPEKDYIVPSNTECYVTGWGETEETGGEGFLKETGFPVIENKVCNSPAYLNGLVKEHEMCAGNIGGGTDSCQGDSGGPLICYSQNTFVLQGVTSWGLGCAKAMKPGVYTRVSKFINWIERSMKEN
uniref:Plasminogen n=1 Tax=Sinocyclocheilus anshuiensis TaxID=1608454 RepID=A0A671N1R0_9TELE